MSRCQNTKNKNIMQFLKTSPSLTKSEVLPEYNHELVQQKSLIQQQVAESGLRY